jgi:hypothetical protein
MREHVQKKDASSVLRVYGKPENSSFQVIVLVRLSRGQPYCPAPARAPLCDHKSLLTDYSRVPLEDHAKTILLGSSSELLSANGAKALSSPSMQAPIWRASFASSNITCRNTQKRSRPLVIRLC